MLTDEECDAIRSKVLPRWEPYNGHVMIEEGAIRDAIRAAYRAACLACAAECERVADENMGDWGAYRSGEACEALAE